MIKIYSKPKCMGCKFAKEYLDERNVPYEEIDTYNTEGALEHIKELGFQGLPVIELEGFDPFQGFAPDLLNKMIEGQK